MFKINQNIKQQILKFVVILLLSIIISEIIVLIVNIIYPKIIGTPNFGYIFCIHRGVSDKYFFNIKKIFLIFSLIFILLTAIAHFLFKQKNNKYIFLFTAIFMGIYSIIPPINFNFAYYPPRIIIFVIILALAVAGYFLYKKIRQENIFKTDSNEIFLKINIKKYLNHFAKLTIFFLLLSAWNRIAIEQFDNLRIYILNCCILASLFILMFIFFKVKFKKYILAGVFFSIFNIFETIYINLSQKTNYFTPLNYYQMVNVQLIAIAVMSFILLSTIIKNSKIKFGEIFKKFFISHFFVYLLFGLLLCSYAVLDGGRNPDILLVGFLIGMFFIKEREFISFAAVSILSVSVYHFIFSGIISVLLLEQFFHPFNDCLCILNNVLEFSYLFPMLLGLFFSFAAKYFINKECE